MSSRFLMKASHLVVLSLVLGSVGCYFCADVASGYHITATFVNADTNEPLGETAFSIRLEGDDGLYRDLPTFQTDPDGDYRDTIILERDSACSLGLFGVGGIPIADHSKLSPPLVPRIAIVVVRIHSEDATVEILVTEEMVTVEGLFVSLDLGIVSVPLVDQASR